MDVLAETVARLLERYSGIAVVMTVIFFAVFLGVIIGIFTVIIKQFHDDMKKF
jgi:hypothetical protein